MADDLYTIQIRYRSEGYDRVSQQYTRLQQSIQGTTQAQTRNNRASQQSARTNSTVQRSARSLSTTQAQVRQQFLNTANSIAILDGPLGGIASRFSALGVLVGRSGLALAGFGAAASALTFTLQAGIRTFVEYQTSILTTTQLLETTGNRVSMTANEIDGLSRSIANETLASTDAIRSASNQLLTFRQVSGDVFGDVLNLAQDMAQLGFGTVESEAVKLAKAIEDPNQSLTSLSRSGITFTRQQRAVIQTLMETGREAEATARILENVERQVGGAGRAAAQGFAGDLDTIRQALSEIREDFARTFLEELDLTSVIGLPGTSSIAKLFGIEETTTVDLIAALANLSSARNEDRAAAEEQNTTQQRLIRSSKQLGSVISSIDDNLRSFQPTTKEAAEAFNNLTALQQELVRQGDVTLQQFTGLDLAFNDVSKSIEGGSRALSNYRAALRAVTAESARQELVRTQDIRDGISEIQEEIRERERNLGLLRQEADARDRLRDLGLYGPQLGPMREFLQGMAESVIQQRQLSDNQQDFQRELEQSSEQLNRQAQQQEILNGLSRKSSELSRLKAQEEMVIQRALELNLDRESDIVQEVLEAIQRKREAVQETNNLERAANRVAGAFGAVNGALDSARSRLVGLTAEANALASGMDRVGARTASTMAQIRSEISGIDAPDFVQDALRVGAAATESALRAGDEQQRRIDELTSSGGGGGSSGGTQRDILGEIQQEIQQRQTLLGLRGEERDIMENVFQIQQRLGDQAGEVSDEMVQSLARQMQELEDAEQTQQRLESLEQQLSLERELAGVNEDRARLIQAMGEQYNNLSQSQANALEEQIRQVRELTEAHERLAEAQQRAAQFATDLFMAAVQGGDDFRDTLRNILLQIARMQAMAAFQNLFSGMGSAGGPLSFLLAPSANGNVFSGGKTVPFASGGVVSSPTMFPMRGNETGLMGEAGPEAIMPLKRGKDGKLGVKSEGRSETPQQSVPTIINVMDPEIVGNYLNTTKGERVIMNVLDRNGVTRG